MWNFRKWCIGMLTVSMLAVVSITSFGATGTSIQSVSLKIDSDIEAGDSSSDVEVTTSSGKYYVDDYEVTNEPDDEWEEDDKPKLKITLEADDDYYFPSGFSKSSVKLSGDDGKVTSVSRSGSDTLYVYVTLDALEDDDDDDDDDDYDLDVSDLEWDEDSGIGSWEDSEDAKRYEVRLYRGGSLITSSTLTTSDNSYDFSDYITQSGTYMFKVRGVYNSSNKGSWEESDSWYVSSSEAAEISSGSGSPGISGGGYSGAWLRDSIGWWYCNADKSYTVNNWQLINGDWYYFNEAGYMVTGWVYWNYNWYYCGSDGAMLTDARTPDGYYVNSDGVWLAP